jgi:hypothetical protein
MSWIDDVVSFGSSALGYLGGNTLGSQLARTALTGLVLNQVYKSVNKSNEQTDKGTRIQVDPNPDFSIPVVYGDAVLSGAITDAVLTNDNGTMYYCITLCEKTGAINLGSGNQSQFAFKDVYLDDNRLLFESDGVTVSGYIDKANNTCTDNLAGKIKIYCFNGNSTSPISMTNYPLTTTQNAYDIMPNWTSNHAMNDLVFAIIRLDYDAEKNVTGLGNVRFKISNSMTQPGDCLYDYMTNTRYGAGIDPTEIYAS